jgi:PepSY-associated TM region
VSAPSARHRLHVIASRAHKWLALIIGVQLLIWFTSGALMSFLPINDVRGEHLVDRETVAPIPSETRFANPANISPRAGAPVQGISWHMLGGRAVAEVTTTKGITLFDAESGAPLPPVDAALATAIATAAWKSPAKPPAKASRVTRESPEYRGALPAWRIAFADPDATSVFVAAETGKITAVRNGTWRLYDFFWGLHIMDWKNHENFNTPWLLGFALGGVALGLAGNILLFMRWPFRGKKSDKLAALHNLR